MNIENKTYNISTSPVNVGFDDSYVVFAAREVDIEQVVVPPQPGLCGNSVGGFLGTEYNYNNSWMSDCLMFVGNTFTSIQKLYHQ